MKIKICGLFREEDIMYVNKYKPDYIGFVFAKSKRQISFDKAKKLKALLNKDIKSVGVFVNEDISFIRKLVKNNIIDMIQLHGNEDEDYIEKLLDLNVEIIKYVKLDEDLSKYKKVDYYLFDNHIPGSGKRFDWSLLESYDKPYFLAGGINSETIDEAKKSHAYALDLSSGVEKDGYKNEEMIKEVVRKIHE